MNKTFKILFAVACTAALFSCNKDESADAVKVENEYWLDSGKLIVTINSDTLESRNAYVILSEKGEDVVLTLKKVLSGYNSFEFKGKKNDEHIVVDTTELWTNGRKVAIDGTLTEGILTLNVSDSTSLWGKWMIGEVEDYSSEVIAQGFKNTLMPAISLKSNIHELYIPVLGPWLTNKENTCRIDVDSICAYFQAYARVLWADPNAYANNNAAAKDTNHLALLDYIQFTRDGKMGICVTDKHAETYFNDCGQGGIYKWVDSLANKYSLSGSSILELVDAEDEHCILNYTEYKSELTGQPCFALSTGIIGGTIIDLLNTILKVGLNSSLHIDAETFGIPVQIFENDEEHLVIGIAVNTLFASFGKIADEINKCTWEEFNQQLPGLNNLIYFAINQLRIKSLFEGMTLAEADAAGLLVDMLGNVIEKTGIQFSGSSIGIADFQINEDIFIIVKPIVASVFNLLASLKDTEISVQIDLIPYKNEQRPWEFDHRN